MPASTTPRLGITMPRSFSPREVVDLARHAEDAGLDDVWVIEDCFFTSGPPLAAAVLAVTERVHVGVGILPAVTRTAALTAMEAATLSGLAPGRVTIGIGHGVQDWMGQMGVRPSSPVGTLTAVVEAVRTLLHGGTVTMDRHGVVLEEVALQQPPDPVPRVLAGVRGPRSMAAMAAVADGILLAEPAAPDYVRWSRRRARGREGLGVATYAPWCVLDDGSEARTVMAPWLADLLDAPHAGFTALSFGDELLARYHNGGVDALASMPADWWTALGPVGTVDDAVAHLRAVAAAGAGTISCYPAPDVARAHDDIDRMAIARGRLT